MIKKYDVWMDACGTMLLLFLRFSWYNIYIVDISSFNLSSFILYMFYGQREKNQNSISFNVCK